MFGNNDISFLLNSFLIENYKKLKIVAIFEKGSWITYLPKKIQNKTMEEGLDLLENEKKFNNYIEEFNKYKESSAIFFEKCLANEKIAKKDLSKFFNYISDLWIYYQKTEFFYTDKACKRAVSNKTIARNLEILEGLKNSGREYLNKIIFGSSSYLSLVLDILARDFNVSLDSLLWSSKEEIIRLYDGFNIDQVIIEKRKKAYVSFFKNNKKVFYEGSKALNFISSFYNNTERDNHSEDNLIKGTIANKGLVIASARVLVYGADSFDNILDLLKKMKKGDILVAETTSPEITKACHKASAILTNQGGLLSHAAIISRELNIPCIVGLENITKIVKDGEILKVDAYNGFVQKIKK